ncbi:site-specific integrase [Pseudomonas mendocina]|nr:site-specific integrase [Pseudomonas mendocina]MBH3338435.1 site-specific integrase [Pseudomonas mendocina]
MTKPWKHPRSGIFYLRREVPEDIRQIIGKREWKVSLRTRDFATARPRFASELIRCEDIFFAAREQLAGRPRVLASDAPKLADRWAQAVLESWESKPEDLTDFLIQPLDGDDATDVQLACDVVDSTSYKARQSAVEAFMKSVLAEHHLPVPDVSEPAYRSLVDAFYSRWCDLCRMALARFAGDWRESMELPFVEKPLAVEQKAAESKLSGPRLSEVFRKWADDKRLTDGDTRSTNKTISEFGATVTRFVELYGDLHVPRITRALCQEFKTALSKLPTKGEGIRGLAAPELIAKAEAEGLPTAGLATVKKQLRALSAVLNFAVQRLAAMDEEPISASGMLRSIAKAARRAETRAAEDKHYTRQDLVAIFSSPLFKGQWQPPRSDFGQALYWLPLLMVYTGARREELAQLLVSDVRKEEGSGIWYLSIAPGDGKTVKTSSSRRKVPLHADLLALGFIDYRNSLPAEGRLFPKLEEHPENGYGHAVGKAWAKYLKEVVGLESQASPAHGFRHTFKTLCREVGIEAAVSDWITGHSIAGVGADYGSNPLGRMARELERYPSIAKEVGLLRE